jgi:hypothetical protein
MRLHASFIATAFLCACATAVDPAKPIAILEHAPEGHFTPVWPVSARVAASGGSAAIEEELRTQARDVGADAVIIQRRYLDPWPAPGDGRTLGLGDPYPGVLESLQPGAFPHAPTPVRTYGPYVIVEGLAIRFPQTPR